MNDLAKRIHGLDGPLVAEAVKNLRIALQHYWGHEVDDQEARKAFEGVSAVGEAEMLRNSILADEKHTDSVERWGRSLLLYVSAEPDLRAYVEEAVDDALESSVKDFGLTSLIILGAVLVLLKYRPKEFEKKADGVKIKWEENDVSTVADLARIVSGPNS